MELLENLKLHMWLTLFLVKSTNLASAIRQEKTKGILIGNEEAKFGFFCRHDDYVLRKS